MKRSPRRDKIAILCVDDEPQILEGLALHLGRCYRMHSATSGAEGLEILANSREIAVVVSDMRMPGMNGAEFLARVRERNRDAVRMLLTGHAEIQAAIAAVNEGQIFRFLTKPCPPKMLLAAVAAAAEQHRLVTAERVLLQQTLYGAIKALTEILALAMPAAFGRANRIKQIAKELAERLELPGRWQLEVAAMLSQLGTISLPANTAERLYAGEPLSPEEQDLVARAPTVTERLLGNIPRLEGIREILRNYPRPYQEVGKTDETGSVPPLARAAHVLRVAVDFDALESAMGDPGLALSALRGRGCQYAPEVLDALAASRDARMAPEVLEVHVEDLREGMILAEDIKLVSGALFIARGQEITRRFIERVPGFPDEVRGRRAWRVVIPPELQAA